MKSDRSNSADPSARLVKLAILVFALVEFVLLAWVVFRVLSRRQ